MDSGRNLSSKVVNILSSKSQKNYPFGNVLNKFRLISTPNFKAFISFPIGTHPVILKPITEL